MIRMVNAEVLFVDDLDRCQRFYRDQVGLAESFKDEASVGFRLEDQDFVLLKTANAVKMISEAALGLNQGAGHRVLLCAGSEDVDSVYDMLTERGIDFIKPPMDQDWGRRTAYFADPEGHLWEILPGDRRLTLCQGQKIQRKGAKTQR